MNKLKIAFPLMIFMLCYAACQKEDANQGEPSKNTLFNEVPSAQSGIDFINNISNSKDFNIFSYRNYYNGGGVGLGDINNDGLTDIYFTSNLGSNKLYINKGDLQFEDITEAAGVGVPEKWSTGVSLVDINSDGWLDIYVCNAGFQKGKDQKNSLFINQQNGTFIEQAALYGLDYNDYSTHAAFFDYDKDGDLDVYLLNNSFIPVNTLNYNNKRHLRAEDWPVADILKGGGDRLLRNDGERFTDVSNETGILGSLIGFGLGVTVGDVNADGWLDIYVSNDFFERDYLYINNHDGTFKEDLESRINHLSHSSMGADMADINNDGAPEIFVTDMLPDDRFRLQTNTTFDNINLRMLKVEKGFYNQFLQNTLQLNNGDGHFKEIAHYAGVAASDWSWGALIFDGDNDGDNDIFVCNGIYHDVTDQDFIDFFANEVIQKMVLQGNKEEVDSIINRMPSHPIVNKFFINDGNMKFEEKGAEMGITKATFSNGAAYGDLDNDGDLDLVINNVNQQAQLYENHSNANFIGFNIQYKGKNHFGLGTNVKVFAGDQVLYRELIPSRGFQSSVDYKMVIGLGDISKVDMVEITWPDGQTMGIKVPEINKYYSLTPDIKEYLVPLEKNIVNTLFEKVDNTLPKHHEDHYVDFYYERNIPTQLSQEGPCLAKGDFNGDGLEDIYIGGATNQAPVLMKNTGKGYVPYQQEYFDKFKAFEDTYAVFFDADQDNDLDLLVASGGNNVTLVNRAFRDRLYINHDGRFEIDFNAIPNKAANTAFLLPVDLEGDGDLDIVAGMRSVPGDYGVSPGSYIYANEGNGRFHEVTERAAPDLALAGMVTDAVIADIIPGGKEEIVITGEWMAPRILEFDDFRYNVIESSLNNYSGLWQSVEAMDVDNDGDQDLILGNYGDNFALQASNENPLFLWINDYDKNGTLDKIITQRADGKDWPVMVKRDMVDQLPNLKKENLLHKEYAKKGIKDLFDPEILAKSVIKQINYLQSAVAINDGQGNFEVHALPPAAQMSCVNAIQPLDVNSDGLQDLVLGGNNEQLLPQFSYIDACNGTVLINNGDGSFSAVKDADTGLNVRGVVREMDIIDYKGEKVLIFMINNAKPQTYKLR